MTNDLCFVDAMEAAILKHLLTRRRLSIFYDTEKLLLGINGLNEFLNNFP